MALEFIEVIDLSCEKDEGQNRHVTFAYDAYGIMGPYDIMGLSSSALHLLGNMPHCTDFTFDKINAQKMVDFLQERIIDRED